jgi:hypothetical protein
MFDSMPADAKLFVYSCPIEVKGGQGGKIVTLKTNRDDRDPPTYQLSGPDLPKLRLPFGVKTFGEDDDKKSEEERAAAKASFKKNAEVSLSEFPQLEAAIRETEGIVIEYAKQHYKDWWPSNPKIKNGDMVPLFYTSPIKEPKEENKSYGNNLRLKVNTNPLDKNCTRFYFVDEESGRYTETNVNEANKPGTCCVPMAYLLIWITSQAWGLEFKCSDMILFPPKDRAPCPFQWGKNLQSNDKKATTEDQPDSTTANSSSSKTPNTNSSSAESGFPVITEEGNTSSVASTYEPAFNPDEY